MAVTITANSPAIIQWTAAVYSLERMLLIAALFVLIPFDGEAYATVRIPEPNATVYLYRTSDSGLADSTIYCNGVELVHIETDRFFSIDLEAGEYLFAMDNEKQHSQIKLKLKAGEMRYVRVQRNLSVVSIQEGQRRVAQSKPVDAANIPKGRKPTPGMTAAGFPILSFKAQITPANGGATLKGGDAFSIHVEVANIGNAPANDIQVSFDGDTAILSAVQADHGQVGLVSPGRVKILDFTGTLPMNVEPHDAEVEIRLSQGQAQLPYVEVLRTTITR